MSPCVVDGQNVQKEESQLTMVSRYDVKAVRRAIFGTVGIRIVVGHCKVPYTAHKNVTANVCLRHALV
jgi:hypothetical protein